MKTTIPFVVVAALLSLVGCDASSQSSPSMLHIPGDNRSAVLHEMTKLCDEAAEKYRSVKTEEEAKKMGDFYAYHTHQFALGERYLDTDFVGFNFTHFGSLERNFHQAEVETETNAMKAASMFMQDALKDCKFKATIEEAGKVHEKEYAEAADKIEKEIKKNLTRQYPVLHQ